MRSELTLRPLTKASDRRRIPSDLPKLVAAWHETWSERETAWAIIAPLDYSPCVRLFDHVADTRRYVAPGLEKKIFHTLRQIEDFFSPLEAADPSFASDRLSVCAAYVEHAETVFHMKAEVGAVDARELYEVLSDRIDVIEDHICSMPCRTVDDILLKVSFALENFTNDDVDWVRRDALLKSIQTFKPAGDALTGLQVAALEAVAEQLG